MALADARIGHLARLARWRDILIPADVTRCATIAAADCNLARELMLDPTTNSLCDTFMARALALSLQNVRSGRGGPFAAVIVKGSEIIAEGMNCVTATNDPTAHAEMVAIREACRKLQSFELVECEIYTSCEPCPMCMGAIYWARPARVYFANSAADAARAGFDDAFIYRELSAPHAERKIPMIQLRHDEAPAAFRAWREKSDKIRY